MQIAPNTVAHFDYTLTDPSGNTLDTSAGREPLAYLHGFGNIIPGLEAAMVGKQAGDEFTVTVPAVDAYGEHDPAMVQAVPRAVFPAEADIQPGQQFHARSPEGEARVVTVKAVAADEITIDANHPLAGVALTFAVKVTEVRAASEEELAHGHVHGA
ncbi:MAG TPA: peptidylprolyl isomerase, partial [Tepidisphaeraceae bacterium]